MIYAVPLIDGSYAIAQAGTTMGDHINVINVALFADRHLKIPNAPIELSATKCVSLAATWRQALNRGEWLSLGWAAEVFRKSEFPNEQLVKQHYVGATTHDAGLLSDFLSAYFGLIPWNAMFDPDFYNELLRPGLKRPKMAMILDKEARAKYRRDVLGVKE